MESFKYPYSTFNNFLDIEPIKNGWAKIKLFSNGKLKSYFFNKFNETYLCIKIKYGNNFFILYSLMTNKEIKEKKYNDFNYDDFFKIRTEKDVRTFFPELNGSEIFFSFPSDSNNFELDENLFDSNELLIYKKEKLFVVSTIGIIDNNILGRESFVRKKDVIYSVDKGDIKIINSDKILDFLESLIPAKRNNRLFFNVYLCSENKEEFSLYVDFKIISIDDGIMRNTDHLERSRKNALFFKMITTERRLDYFYKIYFCKSNLSCLKRIERLNIESEKESLLINYGEFSYLKHGNDKMIPLFIFNDKYMHRYPKKFREWYFKLICIFKNQREDLSLYNTIPIELILHITNFIIPSI
jgi:hypothetical protein